ncbi:hypothetical protein PR001_g33971 [Phytophthora rubi]|uniref:Uncharacterized protein n=1 Tax=Phytophthora rubi TaxID=129364 RepID=A0A6A3FZE9_9STRA|nr:hypothetical protein PR001_g33971 [Phytophthora rubi]
MVAATGGHIDVVRFLVIDCGADVNTKDDYGRTALMVAATVGHIEVVRFLVIDCGADVNTKDNLEGQH